MQKPASRIECNNAAEKRTDRVAPLERGTPIATVLMNSSGGWMTPSITKEEQLHESVKELSTSRNQDRSLGADINGSWIFIFAA